MGGQGVSEYEREALILSRPRRSFGYFPIVPIYNASATVNKKSDSKRKSP